MPIRNKTIWSKIDWSLLILYFILIILGWISIYAAVYNEERQYIFDLSQRYGKQLIWTLFALIIGFTILTIDSKAYPMFSYLLYILVLLSLISVLIFGKEVNSSRSWFEIGDFRLQPAEFAKFATALALSSFMSRQDFNLMNFKNLTIASAIILTPAFLILLQPDTGSALVYLAFVFVLYREGLPGYVLVVGVIFIILFILTMMLQNWAVMLIITMSSVLFFHFHQHKIRETIYLLIIIISSFVLIFGLDFFLKFNLGLNIVIIISLSISVLASIVYAFRKRLYTIFPMIAILLSSVLFMYSVEYIFYNILGDHQQTRIKILLGLVEDLQGAGYNVHQSKIAIGSGGFIGKGFLQGTQTKYNFVPEQDTDFIFCTIGEEWGFFGTLTVIILYLILLIRIVQLSERQKSLFSRIYGYSVASVLFFHVAVNIGMTIGLLPVIGIPLPFFSYGGSSLWSFTILLFIFIKLDVSREEFL